MSIGRTVCATYNIYVYIHGRVCVVINMEIHLFGQKQLFMQTNRPLAKAHVNRMTAAAKRNKYGKRIHFYPTTVQECNEWSCTNIDNSFETLYEHITITIQSAVCDRQSLIDDHWSRRFCTPAKRIIIIIDLFAEDRPQTLGDTNRFIDQHEIN